jgi:hypothetical protein
MFKYEILPESLQGGMRRYIEDRIKPGTFLTRCICNDLVGAAGHCSDLNNLVKVAGFLYNEMPGRPNNIWGSEEAMEAHLKGGDTPT